jgi:ATP-dependent Clp protease ATP-binding subunit ClpC
MFERYSEKARRVIFFARYLASQFGSPYIETEHVLLGLLREDKALTYRFLRSYGAAESIRRQIEARTTIREKTSTAIDLPVTDECKRVLAYAAEEAEGLGHKHIGTQHLLLGLLREDHCFAAVLLHERGLRILAIREEVARSGEAPFVEKSEAHYTFSIVAIDSIPSGSDIEVDGVFLGHTPAKVPLGSGERNVTITRKGYKPWQRTLGVLPGSEQTITAELEQLAE